MTPGATGGSRGSRGSRVSLLGMLQALYARRETIRFLTVSSLKAGHRDKILGHLWSILDPLMFMLVYYFIFGALLRTVLGSVRPIDYMLYMLMGILVFHFIETTVGMSSTTIRANRGIIHEINFPKAIFPISLALTRLYDLVLGLVVLAIMLVLNGILPTIHYAWIPLLLAVTLLFATGAALIVSYLGAFFADTSNVTGIALRLLFYLCPILYFARARGGHGVEIHNVALRFWFFANPVTDLIECWRDAMIWGMAPDWRLLSYVIAFSLGLTIAGLAVFRAGEGNFAKYI